MPEAEGNFRAYEQRGGKGRNGDGTWPLTDGRGCPKCGAIRGGGHGGGCPHQHYAYDEDGRLLGRSGIWDREPRPHPAHPSPWRPWDYY